MIRAISVNTQRQKGLAIVEVTIVLPLLFLLALAAAEFGRMIEQYNVLTKQLQDGARYLSARAVVGSTGIIDLSNPLVSQAVAETQNLVVYGYISANGQPLLKDMTTDDITFPATVAGHIHVQAEYQYLPVFNALFSMFGFGDDIAVNIPLRSSVVMRVVG